MSWSISVTSDVLPNPEEKISSVCSCPGNFYYSVMEMTGKQLRDMIRPKAIEALINLVKELDKGNDGQFNDQWAINSDSQWSDGRETHKEWDLWETFPVKPLGVTDYKSFCGWWIRDRVREDAIRFLLYYRSGYNIEYAW